MNAEISKLDENQYFINNDKLNTLEDSDKEEPSIIYSKTNQFK